MDTETEITFLAAVIIVSLTVVGIHVVLLSIIVTLQKQVSHLQHLLLETTREYKIYQATADKDYGTAGILRNIKKQPIPAAGELDESDESDIPDMTLTQYG